MDVIVDEQEFAERKSSNTNSNTSGSEDASSNMPLSDELPIN